MKDNSIHHQIEVFEPAHRVRDANHRIVVHRFRGTGGGPSIFFQAALHGNEHPGILVLLHLVELLEEAEVQGLMRGNVTIVPVSNPVGMSQRINGEIIGRFDLEGSGNFNRNFPAVEKAVLKALEKQKQSRVTRAEARALANEVFQSRQRPNELEDIKAKLLNMALEADLVFDCHADGESLLYLYAPDHAEAETEELSARLGCSILLLGSVPSSRSFEDAVNNFWAAMAERLSSAERAKLPFAVTLEFRGRNDVDDQLARSDAESLFAYLVKKGVIDGTMPKSKGKPPEKSPLRGVDCGRAPVTGIVVHRVNLGDLVKKGDIVAEIVDPLEREAIKTRWPMQAQTSGRVFSRNAVKLATRGDVVYKIAGNEILDTDPDDLLD